MSFKNDAVDNCSMAGPQACREPGSPLKTTPIAIVDDTDFSAKRALNLRRPFLAAPASWITMHHDVGRGQRRRSDQGQLRSAIAAAASLAIGGKRLAVYGSTSADLPPPVTSAVR